MSRENSKEKNRPGLHDGVEFWHVFIGFSFLLFV